MDWLIPPGADANPAVYIPIAIFAMLVMAVSKGGFGGGAGVICTPLLMTQLPAAMATGLWLPLLIACDVFSLREYPREGRWRAILLLAPWTIAGIIVGRSLFGVIDGRWIKLTVGFLGITFLLMQGVRSWVQRYSAHRDVGWDPKWYHALPFGLGAGVATSLAHAAGGIITMFLLPQKMPPRQFVGTSVRYYLIFNALKVPVFLLGSDPLITGATLKAALWLIPFAPIGVALGAWLTRKINPNAFNVTIYVILTVTSVSLVLRNL